MRCTCTDLRGDYTTCFDNFILYYNFLTNSLKFIKVYIIRKGISQGRQLWYYFFTKHFWKKSQKTRFLPFFFQNRLQKIEILKIALELFYWLKHPFRCCVFSLLWVFANFLSFMPSEAKISLFYKIFKFLTLFGMKFKKSAKTRKNEKTQHLNGCFKSIKQFQSNF